MQRNLIAGQWLEGPSASRDINPSDTRDCIGEFAQADAAQLREAIGAAHAAAPAWAASTPLQRFEVLDAVGTELLARRQELGDLLAREEGKTLPEAVAEVTRAGHIFKFHAGEALRPEGHALPSVRPGVGIELTREPLGVVGLITPWNFPIAIPAWKIAPALAQGNTVVFKPAEAVPASAWALAEILSRAGLPAGTFNLVMGRGLELGGKNPMVVLDDADLEVAVNAAVQSGWYSTGQRCTASSRLIVTPGIHDRFVAALVERLGRLRVDDARKPGTDIGPVIDERQLAVDLAAIERARDEGARLAFGGRAMAHSPDGQPGWYLQPTLFTDTTPQMAINREEVFGPVVSVQRARDDDEALALANDTPFGLAAGIATTSLKRATHFRRHAQAGMVMVNLPTAGVDFHVPFGGRKGSSLGPREQGPQAAEFYSQWKTAYTAA
jgi:alpha-ketoglutaric semialdehyde dehydrogenase